MLDIFAWIVLIVLLLSTIAVVVFPAALPGRIAHGRGHPWRSAGCVLSSLAPDGISTRPWCVPRPTAT